MGRHLGEVDDDTCPLVHVRACSDYRTRPSGALVRLATGSDPGTRHLNMRGPVRPVAGFPAIEGSAPLLE